MTKQALLYFFSWRAFLFNLSYIFLIKHHIMLSLTAYGTVTFLALVGQYTVAVSDVFYC